MQETRHDGLVRIGGISVVLALGIHMYVNGALKRFPPEDATPAELARYFPEEASTWAVVHGLKYLALVGLVLFAAAAFTRTRRHPWGVVGLLGAGIHVTNALIANGIEVLAFYDYSLLSEDPKLFWLLFWVVRTLFTAEIVAWGVFIFGFSMAGLSTRRLPLPISILGLANAAACMVCGVFLVSILVGGRAAPLMDAAAMSGLLWFTSTGVYFAWRGDA